jgi:DNA-binding CsgD family transcriptional regulator
LSAAQQEVLRVIEADIAEITSPFIRNLLANNFQLTFRETQIALLVKQGKSTKEIATILKCSSRAIEFHRHNLRQKLGLTGNGHSLASQLARFE